LRCNSSQYGNSIPLYATEGGDNLFGANFVSKWITDSLSLSVQQHDISNYSMSRNDQNITVYEAQVKTTEQACISKSVLYDVNVTFPRGVQKLEYRLSDEDDMREKWHDARDIWSSLPTSSTLSLTIPAEPQEAENWNQKVLGALPAFNEWAILDALGGLLEGISTMEWSSRVVNLDDQGHTTTTDHDWESFQGGLSNESAFF